MSRALFKESGYSVSKLLADIDAGEIALPEIQRPFVWKPTRVRDLFDSMYRGYPVGYLLFWASATAGARQIGVSGKQGVPRLLIVDGQQRLTSLFAVVKGVPILRDDYSETRLRIAFRPTDTTFAVPDAAKDQDPEYISDISDLWAPGTSVLRFARNFIGRLAVSRVLSETDQDQIGDAISELHGLQDYRFSALELDSSIEEERVADVFVRINSAGIHLNQADFILTLMSVWWDEGRRALETFSRDSRKQSHGPSPFNHFIQPDPDQLLRVAIGLGFRRGQLRAVLSLLRGRDLDTGQFSAPARDRQFGILRDAQAYALDLQHWHDYLKVLVRAGYRSSAMLTSETNVLYSYLFYLIGRKDFGVDPFRLREVIARWFFMSSLTGRYSSSLESTVESDLAQLRDKKTPDEFIQALDQIICDKLGEDFWATALPNNLQSSAAWSPSLFAYYAALNLLDARVLFSRMRIAELLDPATKGSRSALERHHLFPRGHLDRIGISSQTDRNQIANYALVEWPDNASISDRAPADYFRAMFDRLDARQQERARFWHALPGGWEDMEYHQFLHERRRLMAAVVRAGFERLVSGEVGDGEDGRSATADLISSEEGQHLELKSSARFNLHTRARDPEVEFGVVKSVAGFINATGGTLLIGVNDEHEIVGLEEDYKLVQRGDRDRYEGWLVGLLEQCIGKAELVFTEISFECFGDRDVCRIDARPGSRPVFARSTKGGREAAFFVRFGNSTRRLGTDEFQKYERDRWPHR